jgi:hypothetical protein
MYHRRLDPQDIVGSRVGLLKIEAQVGVHFDIRGKAIYEYDCLCDCGNKVRVDRPNLITAGHTRSCGCLKARKAQDSPGWTGLGKISGYLWARIRNQANRKSRTLPFTITKEYVWGKFQEQGGKCALTGWDLNIELSSKVASTRTASLDRIDSTKGYEPGNVQWVHKDVNQMKWDLSSARFIDVCKAVIIFQEAKNGK